MVCAFCLNPKGGKRKTESGKYVCNQACAEVIQGGAGPGIRQGSRADSVSGEEM